MIRKSKEIITYESRHRTVVRKRARMAYGWCGRCSANVLMLLPDEAASLRGVTPRMIYREVENGSLHYEETPDGKIRICCGLWESVKKKKQ